MSAGRRLPSTPEPMHYWTGADGLKLAGDAWGDPHGPLVLLQHGGGQTRHAWKGAGETLGAAGYYAIAFDARGLDQPTPVRVHLYRFADAAAYDRLRQAVDRCAAHFVSDPNAYVAIDASPYVATSAGPWAPGFTDAVRAALTRASRG